jgi:hypothetical protein
LQHICKAHKSHHTKANLAKELQLPTHCKQYYNSTRQNIKKEVKESRLTAAFLALIIQQMLLAGLYILRFVNSFSKLKIK